MILSLSQLKQAANSKPEGYLEDILSFAKIEGDIVELSEIDYQNLKQKYQPPTSETVPSTSKCSCCNKVEPTPPA